MKFSKSLTVAITALGLSLSAYATSANAAGRTGSHRVGGYTSHGNAAIILALGCDAVDK